MGVLLIVKLFDWEMKVWYDFFVFVIDNFEFEVVLRRIGFCDVVIWIWDINDNVLWFLDDIYEGGV